MTKFEIYKPLADDIRDFVANKITLHRLFSQHRSEIDYEGRLAVEFEVFFAELCYHIKLHNDDYELSIYEIHENFEKGKFSKELLCRDLKKTKQLQQYINRMLIFLNEHESKAPIKHPKGYCSGKIWFGVLGYIAALIFFINITNDFWYGYLLTSVASGVLIWFYYIFDFYVLKSTQRNERLKPFTKFKHLSRSRRNYSSFKKIFLTVSATVPEKKVEEFEPISMFFGSIFLGFIAPLTIIMTSVADDNDSFKLKDYHK